MTQKLILRHGDCVAVLGEYKEGSVGAFICDPPYDLTAVSRGGSPRQAGTGPFGRHELDTVTIRGGFMGKKWDGTGIAFSADLWDEVYRVLRPGGVVKAFSGTRTFHRMAAAMTEAGFVDLRIESWNYGSGFPKSMNIGKALDKAARGVPHGGSDPTSPNHGRYKTQKTEGKRGALDRGQGFGAGPGSFMKESGERHHASLVEEAQLWDGWGTALKPSWEPVVVGRKPE